MLFPTMIIVRENQQTWLWARWVLSVNDMGGEWFRREEPGQRSCLRLDT